MNSKALLRCIIGVCFSRGLFINVIARHGASNGADGILTRLAVRGLRNVLGVDYEKIPVTGRQI